MLISNVAFVNFTGYLATTSNSTASVSCSTRSPCYNIDFKGIDLAPQQGAAAVGAEGTCQYIDTDGVHGMTGSGC